MDIVFTLDTSGSIASGGSEAFAEAKDGIINALGYTDTSESRDRMGAASFGYLGR